MVAKKEILIPFSKTTGDLINYVWGDESNIEWKKNFIFEDTLRYVDYFRGRSAMSINLESITTGIKYTLTYGYFDEMIRSNDVIIPGPCFKRSWTFYKQGSNYNIKPID